MIKEVARNLRAVIGRLLQVTLLDEVTAVLCELQIHTLVRSKAQLLVQLAKVVAVLCLSRLLVDLAQEVSNKCHGLWNVLKILTSWFCVFQNVLK